MQLAPGTGGHLRILKTGFAGSTEIGTGVRKRRAKRQSLFRRTRSRISRRQNPFSILDSLILAETAVSRQTWAIARGTNAPSDSHHGSLSVLIDFALNRKTRPEGRAVIKAVASDDFQDLGCHRFLLPWRWCVCPGTVASPRHDLPHAIRPRS